MRPPEPDRKLSVHTAGALFQSDLGYRFAALPEPNASIVRIDVRYPVGAADDPPGKEGLAHLVEHLLFDVEIKRADQTTSISAELGRFALWWNAETTEDFTTYSVIAPADALDDVLGLEADRISRGCGGITPEIFAREREVVLNELRQRQGASGAAIERAIVEQIYPAGHPYRAVDSVDTVSQITFKDVCDFLVGPYHRGQALVVASGAIDERRLRHAAADQFAHMRARSKTERPAVALVQPNPGTSHVRADVDEPELVALWPLPAGSTRDYRMLELLPAYITYELDSFGWEYHWGRSADVRVIGGQRAPVLAVSVTLNAASNASEAIDAMETSVTGAIRLIGSEQDSSQWRAAWQDRALGLLAGWESLSRRNAMLPRLLDSDLGNGLLVGRIEELTHASPSDVASAARTWLAQSRARFVVVEPSGVPGRRGAKTYAGGAEAHGIRVDESLADRPLAMPNAHLRVAVERYSLDNGLDVVLWPNGSAPIVHGELVIHSGSAHDPAGAEGVSQLVGASDVGADSMVFSDRDLSTRVDEMIHRLTIELREPGYEVTDDHKKLLRGLLHRRRAQEVSAYTRALDEAVYGAGHPYARPIMTETSIDRIHTDLVLGWARTHIVPKNATLIITGSFDAEIVKKQIAFYVDQTAGGHDPSDIASPHVPAAKFIGGELAKSSPTVQLDVAFLGSRGLDEGYAKRLVLQEVLHSKLDSLRSKRALTYGFAASYVPRAAGGMWWITGDADATRASEAADAVVSILAEIRSNPDSYRREFVLARQKVLESLVATSADSGAIAERLVFMAQFDIDDEYFERLARNVAKMTVGDLRALISDELAAKQQIFGAFGNADAVKSALDAARKRVASDSPSEVPVIPVIDAGTASAAGDVDAGPVPLAVHAEESVPSLVTLVIAPAWSFAQVTTKDDYGSYAHDLSGATIAADVGVKERDGTMSLGAHFAAAQVSGPGFKTMTMSKMQPAMSLTPIDLGVYVRAIFADRIWGQVMTGVRATIGGDGTTGATSMNIMMGLQGGLDLLKLGTRHFGIYGRLETELVGDTGYEAATIGLDYRN